MKTNSDKRKYNEAVKRVMEVKRFYRHLLWFVIINLFSLLCLQIGMRYGAENSDIWILSTLFIAILWAMILGVHALLVFKPRFPFGRKWEERKIRKYMRKDGNSTSEDSEVI